MYTFKQKKKKAIALVILFMYSKRTRSSNLSGPQYFVLFIGFNVPRDAQTRARADYRAVQPYDTSKRESRPDSNSRTAVT